MFVLQANAIEKRFGGVAALSGVNLSLRPGEIHALMGENGAGKSTLIKVLTGFHLPDAGAITLRNHSIFPRTPLAAQNLGISTVYQEVNLIPDLSIAENISLGRQPKNFWGIDWKAMELRAVMALDRLGLKLNVKTPLKTHSIAVQQMVAIARALDVSSSVLILDEPTSSLDADEVKRLFEVLRKLRKEGMAILFVTHFLDQVYAISDRITVLRNGKTVGEYLANELPKKALVAKMMGVEEPDVFHAQLKGDLSDPQTQESSLLELKNSARQGTVNPIQLSFRASESVGLAGLLGSGRSEIARMIFGIEPADSGEIRWQGKRIRFKNPRQAIHAGLGLTPEDRKTQAILPDLSIRENMILALQIRRGWFKRIPLAEQMRIYAHFQKVLHLVAASPEQSISTLSGGNQQKVILARWLASDPKLLILDEPTRGIDVGAKAEVQKLVHELCRKGMAILFISSELEEVVACSHRVAVLRDRIKVKELAGADVSEKRILSLIADGVDHA